MVGNNQLTFAQELVSHAHAFVEQPAGILPQIEDQSSQVAHLVQRVSDFMLGGFVKAGNVHVPDSGLDQEMQIDAVARNLVADDRELQRFVGAFAQNSDVNRGAFRSFEQVGDIAGAHVVSRLAIDGGNDVAWPDAGAISRSANKGCDDDDLIVARPNRHADAVIFAALIFAQQRISFWIKEIRVRIKHVQHARYGAVINGFVGVYRFGVVLFDHIINSRELAQAIAHVGVTARGSGRIDLLSEDDAQKTAGD